MNAPSAPVDSFEVAPYTRNDLLFHVTGGILCGLVILVAIVWLFVTWRAQPPVWFVIPVAFFVGVYAADFVSGLLHWAFDTWFDENITFIRRMVIMVREHHVYPNRIFQYSFYHDAGTLSWIALSIAGGPVLWMICMADPRSMLASFTILACLVFSLLLVFMLEFHKRGHSRQAPEWIRLLQRTGFVLSFHHHMQHHSRHYDHNYCLINGWADRTLGRLGVFRGLEWLINWLTGATPRRNDRDWSRRFGQKGV